VSAGASQSKKGKHKQNANNAQAEAEPESILDKIVDVFRPKNGEEKED